MYSNSILTTFASFFVLIMGHNYEREHFEHAMIQPRRASKSSFDAQFYRGRCPDQFYQLGNECLYFGTDGRKYSWYQVQNICQSIIDHLVKLHGRFTNDQVSIDSRQKIRQLTLNTPEKTKILEALYREYDELSFAVRLPSDYTTLDRCPDNEEDHWPHFCSDADIPNATCFETSTLTLNNICLRQVHCNTRYSRLACEFTLPESLELTGSKFRHCPKAPGIRHRLSVWVWLLVGVGGMLLLLLMLGGILRLIQSSKKQPIPVETSSVQRLSKEGTNAFNEPRRSRC